MSSSTTSDDERRRRLAVLQSSVGVALKTLDEFSALLAREVDAGVCVLTVTQVRDVTTVLWHVANGMVSNAYVDGVSIPTWASRLYAQLAEEFPDIVQ